MKNNKCATIAIVSGKGGSGKTMISAVIAKLLDSQGKKVYLIDSDMGTGGLMYYLGINTVSNISEGLTNIFPIDPLAFQQNTENKCGLQKMKGFESGIFIGVGDHRGCLRNNEEKEIFDHFPELITILKDSSDVIIVDCRGGIDDESLQVCKSVDIILIVAETDPTSYQTTQHLVEVLYDNNISGKMRGFFINKAFGNPSVVASNGGSVFKTSYLSAIPFDIEAMRGFLIGDIPSSNSFFYTQVWHGLYKALPKIVKKPNVAQLSFTDFDKFGINGMDSLLGGLFIAISSLTLGLLFFVLNYHPDLFATPNQRELQYSLNKPETIITILIIFSLLASIEPMRKLIGKGIKMCIQLIRFIISSTFSALSNTKRPN